MNPIGRSVARRACISEYFARAPLAPGNRITAPETSPLFFLLPLLPPSTGVSKTRRSNEVGRRGKEEEEEEKEDFATL